MKVVCIIVPPGGGEADYQLGFELPAVPQHGDYISVMRKGGEPGYEHFIVRRIRWELEFPETGVGVETAEQRTYGTPATIWVECEFAIGPMPSENHKRVCKGYENRGAPIQTFEDSAY